MAAHMRDMRNALEQRTTETTKKLIDQVKLEGSKSAQETTTAVTEALKPLLKPPTPPP